jgi:hypothetical protein
MTNRELNGKGSLSVFRTTDWAQFENGNDWPASVT